MDYSDTINTKVEEIYSKYAAELEKEHNGEIVAIDFINEKIFQILKSDKISELIKNLKKTETKVAFRKIGEKEAVFHFR